MSIINLHHADNLPAMKAMPDRAFQLAIIDPPYGIDGNCNRAGRHKGKLAYLNNQYHDALWSQEPPSQEFFDELFRVSKHQIIWGINYFVGIRDLKIGPGRIVWDKCNPGTSYSDCEIAYCSTIESVRLFRYMWNGMMQGRSISEGHIKRGNSKENEVRIHPTQKPVAIYHHLLSTYAKPDYKILDTHSGSGSLMIAAYDLGFDLTAFEIDSTYYQDSKNRYDKHTSQHRLFEPNNWKPNA